MSIEAMKQALEALSNTDTHPISSAEQYLKEIEAMEALEDAIDDTEEREWQGLTDEEIRLEWHYLHDDEGNSPDEWVFARAIETKLKEKNHVS